MPDAMVPFPELIAQAECELAEIAELAEVAEKESDAARAVYNAKRNALNKLLARYVQAASTLGKLREKAAK